MKDDLVKGRVPWAPPHDASAVALGRQVDPVLEEPEQRLPDAAQLGDLVDDEADGVLHPAVRVLLQSVTDLDEPDRGRDDKFAAPGLLVARGQGTLAQEVELILVQAALEPEEQAVVAVPWRIQAHFLIPPFA
jgi:hypothetical protein